MSSWRIADAIQGNVWCYCFLYVLKKARSEIYSRATVLCTSISRNYLFKKKKFTLFQWKRPCRQHPAPSPTSLKWCSIRTKSWTVVSQNLALSWKKGFRRKRKLWFEKIWTKEKRGGRQSGRGYENFDIPLLFGTRKIEDGKQVSIRKFLGSATTFCNLEHIK